MYADSYKNNFPHYRGWRAELFDHYFYVDGEFNVEMCRDLNFVVDNQRYSIGNYFRHREDADAHAKSMRTTCGIF